MYCISMLYQILIGHIVIQQQHQVFIIFFLQLQSMDQKEVFSQMRYIPFPEQYEEQNPFKLVIKSEEQRFSKTNVKQHLEHSVIKPFGYKVISKKQVHLFFETMDKVIDFSPPTLFANCELNLQSCQQISSYHFLERTNFKEELTHLCKDNTVLTINSKERMERNIGTATSLEKLVEQDENEMSTELNSCHYICYQNEKQQKQLIKQQTKEKSQILTSVMSSLLLSLSIYSSYKLFKFLFK